MIWFLYLCHYITILIDIVNKPTPVSNLYGSNGIVIEDTSFDHLKNYNDSEIVNVGCGIDQTIRELAETIKNVSGFCGKLFFDGTRPDGTPQKLLDTSKMNGLGWKPKIPLKAGLEQVYKWYSMKHKE